MEKVHYPKPMEKVYLKYCICLRYNSHPRPLPSNNTKTLPQLHKLDVNTTEEFTELT